MRKLVALLAVIFSLSVPVLSYAAFNVEDTGVGQTGDAAYGTQSADNLNIGVFVGTFVIKPALGILGLLFLCLMVYAGFLWITALGDEKKITKAKNIMVNSVIGTVIVVAAYAVSNFVIDALS